MRGRTVSVTDSSTLSNSLWSCSLARTWSWRSHVHMQCMWGMMQIRSLGVDHTYGHSYTQENRWKSRIQNFKWSHHGLDGCVNSVDTDKLWWLWWPSSRIFRWFLLCGLGICTLIFTVPFFWALDLYKASALWKKPSNSLKKPSSLQRSCTTNAYISEKSIQKLSQIETHCYDVK